MLGALSVRLGTSAATSAAVALFADDPSVFTFSMHCGDQPFPAVVQQSDWDIALPAGTCDDEYLRVSLPDTACVAVQTRRTAQRT